MPLDKSAPLRLDDFGQLDAVAIVATMGMLKSEKQRRAFRRCGIRLGDGTNAVDSRAGTDARIRHIDAGLAIMATMGGPEVHRVRATSRRLRQLLRALLSDDNTYKRERIMLNLAAHAGWHQEVLCALEWVKLAL
ncbi:uncharacterized protein CCOS01_02944 [Colletotrichum costaricense]|uniref:Uncharacterized protein n=1 Tax=Colletotrichum costaricense TaxID=1209916 RepID=A0AAI9Z5F9_9PEZI|nr:uncharacterized protein CCOS01_02944 [Colletotrichum costaricense]KAK1534192.1 hypothetical protein CCOS01_02944 [Colletotrichum costaricense]